MKPEIRAFHNDMRAWRHDLHRHPELAFEEERTSSFVTDKLKSFGIEVHTGIAGTGVVGVIEGANGGNRAIGLRADMDALPIMELNDLDYASENDGVMHACGHDGHTTMLLGAARYLAETRRFAGTVYVIFQPAEEGAGGGRAMIEDGLFERFPAESVFGLHNWPGIPTGEFAIRPGPMMASMDTFEIAIEGLGAHAAMPHLGHDPVVAAGALVGSLQTIASRETAPTDPLVVSVTQVHAGDAYNVIPQSAVLRGTVRAFKEAVQEKSEAAIRRVAEGNAAAYRVSIAVDYRRHYPVTVNAADETEFSAEVAAGLVGADGVHRGLDPSMAAEDFAFMLEARPGAYIWLGNGPSDGGRILHSPRYDFNDDILPLGASYWAELAERALPKRE